MGGALTKEQGETQYENWIWDAKKLGPPVWVALVLRASLSLLLFLSPHTI